MNSKESSKTTSDNDQENLFKIKRKRKQDCEKINHHNGDEQIKRMKIANSKKIHDINAQNNESDNKLLNKYKLNLVNRNRDATKESLNQFKNKLVTYKTELNKLKEELQKSLSKVYETSEAKLQAQLKTEETIAKLKILNGFNINDDESVLPAELQLEIESIQNTNDTLIEQTELHEYNLISESESSETKAKVNKILAELDGKIELIYNLKKYLDSGSLKEKENIKKVKQELNIKANLKKIKEKISLLPFNAKQVIFVENKQDVSKIGHIEIEEAISFAQLNIFKFKEVEFNNQTFTLPSRIFEILESGNYLVGGFVASTQKSHLFIYDPIKKRKTHEVKFENRIIDELFTLNDNIFFSLRAKHNFGSFELQIMDENLNLIKKKFTWSILKGVDASKLYCVTMKNNIKLVIYDWDLNIINSDIHFQDSNPKKSFYLQNVTNSHYYKTSSKINQFFKRDNKYILNYKSRKHSPHELCIFSEFGDLLKNKAIHGEFFIDSNNNIIVNNKKNDLIEYYGINGDLIKTVSYKRPKNEYKLIKKIKIDSADNIYFIE